MTIIIKGLDITREKANNELIYLDLKYVCNTVVKCTSEYNS